MTMRDKIDGVLIDPDENGFHLILSGEEREYNLTLDQSAAADLLLAVKTEIEPWWTEALAVRGSMPTKDQLHEFSGEPYDQNDPKHPDYHDTMSELWDNREGK